MTDKLHSGEIYYPTDDSIMEVQLKCLDKLYDFNATRPSEMEKRIAIMKEMFGDIGEGCYIEPPFHANWGGKHCHFGKKVYANFNLTCVDDTHIYVGDYTMIGPNVTIATAGHPICPELREKEYQYNMPVHIGRNCWLGAGVIVMPGVTIGDNTVIGAGSIVTKDIPSGVVAVGNPCRVLREVSEHDYEYYYKDKKIPEEMKVKQMDTLSVNDKEYTIIKLLGKGKGGYSYLATDGERQYVLKQIHHEPCSYYTFGNKIEAEQNDYRRLQETGIRIPQMLDIDIAAERILKEYIDGPTIFELVKEDKMKKIYVEQMKEMAAQVYSHGLNIDYFPTNLVVQDDLIYYIDYECNGYMEEWNFENWGIKYWSKSPEFLEYVRQHD